MSVAQTEIDALKYGKLLAKALPTVIKTAEENDRMLAVVEELMKKGNKLTPEEGELLTLLGKLISDFEEEFYPPEDVTPLEALHELMEVRGKKQNALVEIFGSKGITSEVINGKRSISKAQAKALAGYFHVSVELFI